MSTFNRPSVDLAKYQGLSLSDAVDAANTDGWTKLIAIDYESPTLQDVEDDSLQLWLGSNHKVAKATSGPRYVYNMPGHYRDLFVGLSRDEAETKAVAEGWTPMTIPAGVMHTHEIKPAGTMVLHLDRQGAVRNTGS